jgi:hypothetical protein
MADINTGDTVRISAAFTNLAGAATDPTVISLILKENDGAPITLVFGASSMVKASVGNYHYDYLVPSVKSVYKVDYRWVGTGTVAAAAEGTFFAVSRM